MDNLTLEQRRRTMAAVQSKGTAPELMVRRMVHALGYRFRLHRTDLPGKPDLVFPSRKKVIFVHGCYWHRHRCARGRIIPASNRDYWQSKLARNAERDRTNRRRLRSMGWELLEIWECQLAKNPQMVERHICSFLS